MTNDPAQPTEAVPIAEPVLPRRGIATESTGDRLIRWGAAFSVLVVTGIAAVISYGHAYRLVTRYGEIGATAQALPLTIDGLVATCSLVILHYTRKRRRAPWHAWGLLVIGVCATVGANVANGLGHGIVGAIVAGWPALVAVGSFELLIRLLRDGRPTSTQRTTDHVPASRTTEQPAPTHPPDDAAPAAPPPILDPDVRAAITLYTDELSDGEIPSIRRIKRDLRIGHPKATRIHAALAQPTSITTQNGHATQHATYI
ncbi:DUF2637 domain-containing protein [Sphaerisporangium sp. NPDC005288]|uniref:DUF2637 domain-containing protein n=1 Tax=Sphaerisporangium sp. NPDC005288 TaxID=3155114 RepID=UPI00339F7A92